MGSQVLVKNIQLLRHIYMEVGHTKVPPCRSVS